MISKSGTILKQRGYAVIATAIFILMATSMSALFTARSAIIEERVSSNDYKVKRAFEAAEAGIEFGISYIKENRDSILVDANSDGFIDAYNSADVSDVALSNGTSYSVTFRNPIANNFDLIEVRSSGQLADNSVSRTITQQLIFRPFLSFGSPAAIVAQNNVDISGSLTVTNNESGLTIWSGGATTIDGSAETDAGNGNGSDSNNIGNDVQANDTVLSSKSGDEFFYSFFGATKENAINYADIIYSNSGNTNYSDLLDNVTNKIIWISQADGEVQFSGNAVIGSPDEPVIMIVDGDLKANGVTTVHGVVYVMNNSNLWMNDGGGTLDVTGSVIVEGSMDSTGTPDVTYREVIVNTSQELGDYVKVPGTWRDF